MCKNMFEKIKKLIYKIIKKNKKSKLEFTKIPSPRNNIIYLVIFDDVKKMYDYIRNNPENRLTTTENIKNNLILDMSEFKPPQGLIYCKQEQYYHRTQFIKSLLNRIIMLSRNLNIDYYVFTVDNKFEYNIPNYLDMYIDAKIYDIGTPNEKIILLR